MLTRSCRRSPCFTAALLLLYCCFTAANAKLQAMGKPPMLYCCLTVALLLLYCCFTVFTAALLQAMGKPPMLSWDKISVAHFGTGMRP